MLRPTVSVVLSAVLVATIGAQGVPPARQRGPAEYEALAREILRELIEIDTTQSGSTTQAAEADQLGADIALRHTGGEAGTAQPVPSPLGLAHPRPL